MTDVYDALMDALAALAVAAVHSPVTAVQAYWLALVAQQNSGASPLTLGALLQRAQEDTGIPMPAWAQPLAPRPWSAWCARGVWWDNPCTAGLAAGVYWHSCCTPWPGGGALADRISAVC